MKVNVMILPLPTLHHTMNTHGVTSYPSAYSQSLFDCSLDAPININISETTGNRTTVVQYPSRSLHPNEFRGNWNCRLAAGNTWHVTSRTDRQTDKHRNTAFSECTHSHDKCGLYPSKPNKVSTSGYRKYDNSLWPFRDFDTNAGLLSKIILLCHSSLVSIS
jgi:hypothetical protein